eukprot:TRINITY_DN7451_c0_g1_i11.p1 TRINITY_DN7451_c0_g1~~TRINITY_DN7451_c0_g1_i11.p1  ORF type:complete len:498 (+),score=131.96 TRINITY_DN7451_c0_g1_i11:156-1649(+)
MSWHSAPFQRPPGFRYPGESWPPFNMPKQQQGFAMDQRSVDIYKHVGTKKQQQGFAMDQRPGDIYKHVGTKRKHGGTPKRVGNPTILRPKESMVGGRPKEPMVGGRTKKWDKEPVETKDKVKELQQSMVTAEKKIQELQQTIAKNDQKATEAQNREKQLSGLVTSANSDFEMLKGDFEMLKNEVIYAHRELEVILEENHKLKALGDQCEQALLQAADELRKYQDPETHPSNSKLVAQAELTARQAELDTLNAQHEATKSAADSLRRELRLKENQLKETMEFNKKSMAVTARLNECVKVQEKEIGELRWSKGMLQNEVKEKGLKIEALELVASAPPAVPAALGASAAELASKDQEIADLKAKLQESARTMDKIKQEQNIRIPWNSLKLSASAQEYLGQLVQRTNAPKRKRVADESSEELAMHMNKRVLRNVMLSEKDLGQESERAMAGQQAVVSRVQRSLLQQQKALREAQEDLEANYARKRCLEARCKVCWLTHQCC